MTKIQVDAANLRETIRHNEAVEASTKEANRINEEHYVRADTVAQSQAAEVARHNVAGEDLTRQGLVINANALEETRRHNQASEAIGVQQVGVGYAQAAAAQASAAANMLGSQAAMINAQTSALLQPSQSALNYANAQTAQTQGQLNSARVDNTNANTALTINQAGTEAQRSALISAQTNSEIVRQGVLESERFRNDTQGVSNLANSYSSVRNANTNRIEARTNQVNTLINGIGQAFRVNRNK